uniref:Uncharacterized protein n=1 Tax=Cacopsylla melanoneura TaxID=428564 RepID=A0A8D8SUB5_9HEMI
MYGNATCPPLARNLATLHSSVTALHHRQTPPLILSRQCRPLVVVEALIRVWRRLAVVVLVQSLWCSLVVAVRVLMHRVSNEMHLVKRPLPGSRVRFPACGEKRRTLPPLPALVLPIF